MSRYDGSDEPLTYGEALVETARRAPWGSEAERAEILEVIQREHGLYQEPDRSEDPEDVARAKEAVRLTEENEALRRKVAQRERDDELEKLRKENEALRNGDGSTGADDKAPVKKAAARR